jgi:aerobic-type carbon monoxide dehydrogenase small subunit (CoxS/CutS family)
MAAISLRVNGQDRSIDVDPAAPLLWVLRDGLGLTGTKYCCGIGECGACTVIVDGSPVRSCSVTASSAVGKTITTIEGLSAQGDHPVQKAWLAENVSQCGYCQPAQVLVAANLLESTPLPTDAEITAAMSGILCRCGTYGRIRRAIKRAAGG